jgi:arsenate reductase-like glutaredoxin family protein
MTDLTLYHNPRCSKSRGALELLEARGLPTIVRYLETPPDAATLKPCSASWASAHASCCAAVKTNTRPRPG